MEERMTTALLEEYTQKITPILPAAKKANGSRKKATPEHDASREYTKLLVEYYNRGGSLPQLATALGVAYSGIRRRVVMNDVSIDSLKSPLKIAYTAEDIQDAAQRVKQAKSEGQIQYHDQLALEFSNGIPLAPLSKAIGLTGAAPLYYGVQRSIQRNRQV
jgi:hypothetical protein